MPSSVFVGGILMSVRTMSGPVRSTASRSSSRSPDISTNSTSSMSPRMLTIPSRARKLSSATTTRIGIAPSLVAPHIPRKPWCPHHELRGASATADSANPLMPRGAVASILDSGGRHTFVHDGRGRWDGEVEIEPVAADCRFGVDRRPSSPALKRLGAKAILVRPGDACVLEGVVESKLRPPPGHPRSVPRTALVNRLRAAGAFPLVLVAAPAGYGKTTLLSQWAARD